MTVQFALRLRSIAVLCCLALNLPAIAGPTDISNEPLAQALSAVKPNIMFILDDSGSMDWDYLPDYVVRLSSNQDVKNCRNDADGSGNLSSALVKCVFGDVPYNAYEFNAQYYNPNIYYQASPAPGGLDDASRIMNSANTTSWTAVPNNYYDSSKGTINLPYNYPDRVWCSTSTPTIAQLSDTNVCRTSADHTYPTTLFKYGVSLPSVYCNTLTPSTADLANTGVCKASATGAYKNRFLGKISPPYYYHVVTPQYCTDQTLTSCQASADATHTVAAPVRFCTDNSLTTCKGKWDETGYAPSGSFPYPYFAGKYNSIAISAKQATAKITVNSSITDTSVSVSSIMAGGVNLLGSTTVTAAGGTNSGTEQTNAAQQIANAINANTNAGATHHYTASYSGNVVTVTAPNTPPYSLQNGVVVQPVLDPGLTASRVTFTISGVGNSKNKLNSITIGTVPNVMGGAVTLTSGNTTKSATDVAAAINNYNNGAPWNYTATASGNTVTIYAPLDMGAVPNGTSVSASAGTGITYSIGSSMSGGTGGANLPLTTTNFSGGQDAAAQGWASDIQFERIDIVPGKTFSRQAGSDRPDCASATVCTYDEEMTNFANWYAYYRTRLMSAKSAAGRAFAPIGDEVRAGFITISPVSPYGSSSADPVIADRYLRVTDFDSSQKTLWYNKLYKVQTNNWGTPLREALSRVGRYFAGKTDGLNTGMFPASPTAADDPIQYACQPNFSILITDGYWNGNGGQTLDSKKLGNEDNVDAGFSKRSDGAYDGGSNSASGTLADVAMYYYKNDLRSDMDDIVLTSLKDTNKMQHMSTFTVGLGLSGKLLFDPNYETAKSGDFYNITKGVNTSAGTNNWPIPAANTETALDDLWHAAVNGRGTFYSARNPREFSNALIDTLTQMRARTGAASAASVSNLQPSSGDNFVYTAQYQTATWTGDVLARTLDPNTGTISTAAPLWSAGALLNARNYADRVIYTYDSTDTAGNKLKSFCWPGDGGANCNDGTGLTVAEQAYFATSQLGQYLGWTSAQKAAATGASLVNFLRGDRTLETTGLTAATDLYRSRFSVLGDIVHAQPAYSKKSPFEYDVQDTKNPHYAEFRDSTKTRLSTVFVASNDGMLHAFETDVNNDPYYQTAGIETATEADDTYTGNNDGNGEERWAYVPGLLLPQLYNLAASPYTHKYFADGSPVIGDICVGHTKDTPCASPSDWRTILVAGLNAGGRGYYALDVTNPSTPKALWEFSAGNTCLSDTQANSGDYSSDCNLGLSFGEALIVKRPIDDRWVVIVSSGYNNVNPGSGQGYLYILDAVSGKILQRISTGVGTAGTAGNGYTDANPSGLGKINGWVNQPMFDNQTLAVYGGDLLGNLWRFDLDPQLVAGVPSNAGYAKAFKLTTVVDSLGNPQPITVRPELAKATQSGVPYRVVMFGTGRYLGASDPGNKSQQSIYAIRDDLSTTPVITRDDLDERQFVADATDATLRNAKGAVSMDWIHSKGWYIDLPDSGERVNVDPVFIDGLLTVASNVPKTDVCLGGGYAWLNYFSINGTGVAKNPGTSLIVGITPMKAAGGGLKIITQDSSGNIQANEPKTDPLPPVLGKRVSWRELISE